MIAVHFADRISGSIFEYSIQVLDLVFPLSVRALLALRKEV